MGETSKISSSKSRVVSGTGFEKVPPGVPPVLRSFWDFTKSTAKKFSRHLAKDRTDELSQGVIDEFRHE